MVLVDIDLTENSKETLFRPPHPSGADKIESRVLVAFTTTLE